MTGSADVLCTCAPCGHQDVAGAESIYRLAFSLCGGRSAPETLLPSSRAWRSESAPWQCRARGACSSEAQLSQGCDNDVCESARIDAMSRRRSVLSLTALPRQLPQHEAALQQPRVGESTLLLRKATPYGGAGRGAAVRLGHDSKSNACVYSQAQWRRGLRDIVAPARSAGHELDFCQPQRCWVATHAVWTDVRVPLGARFVSAPLQSYRASPR